MCIRDSANRGGLLAFDVGVGKTYTGIGLLARARQEGWVKRPVILVPNSIIWKWHRDVARVLPDYRVAVIGSKQKIKAADIPAATQLFTPHWIVRFLVENSLGRLWMLNHPNSRLAERMDYYIRDQSSVIGDQSGVGTDHGSSITDYLRPPG